MSAETRALLARFTQILKDLSTGVPTAYDDLTKLLESSSTQLESTFKNLPGFLQKLIKTLPSKLEPGVLQAAAAASPALVTEGGIVGLKELVTKPGLLMGLLKSVVNLLKTRFPALLGANAALSMGLFGGLPFFLNFPPNSIMVANSVLIRRPSGIAGAVVLPQARTRGAAGGRREGTPGGGDPGRDGAGGGDGRQGQWHRGRLAGRKQVVMPTGPQTLSDYVYQFQVVWVGKGVPNEICIDSTHRSQAVKCTRPRPRELSRLRPIYASIERQRRGMWVSPNYKGGKSPKGTGWYEKKKKRKAHIQDSTKHLHPRICARRRRRRRKWRASGGEYGGDCH